MSVQAPQLPILSDVGPAGGLGAGAAAGNWRSAWRRLRRNRAAVAAGLVFVLILLWCGPIAPLWVHFVSHRGPGVQNMMGTIAVGGHQVPVVSAQGTPIGPGLRGAYLLGADSNGRDLFVRVLYGGRTSLIVGIASALICTFLALLLALPAGYYGGKVDRGVSALLDLIW